MILLLKIQLKKLIKNKANYMLLKMVTYKIIIEDRGYEKVCYYNSLTLNKVEMDVEFSPRSHKMFNQDIFEIEGNKIKILHSMIREIDNIPGVISCNSNKTYGKYKKKHENNT